MGCGVAAEPGFWGESEPEPPPRRRVHPPARFLGPGARGGEGLHGGPARGVAIAAAAHGGTLSGWLVDVRSAVGGVGVREVARSVLGLGVVALEAQALHVVAEVQRDAPREAEQDANPPQLAGSCQKNRKSTQGVAGSGETLERRRLF